MSGDRRKEIEFHLTEDELDEKLREADDEHRLRRIGFIKNLYQGDTVAEAADREGRSESTGDRWADAWNEGGLEALMPDFGGGRPPKLDEEERQDLLELLRDGEPWTSREIRQLLKREFDVEYHPDYLGTFLRNLGLSYSDRRSPRAETVAPGDGDEEGDDDRENGRTGGWILDDSRSEG